MLCDHDALPSTIDPSALEQQANGRLRVFPRYHVENYFLDPVVLARVFSGMEPEGYWLRDPIQIDSKLRELAAGLASYATALIVTSHFRQLAGNVDIMPKGLQQKSIDELCVLFEEQVEAERTRFESALDLNKVTDLTRQVGADISSKLADPSGAWKIMIPGRPVLHSFASAAI
jgi:hypothetical protein